MDKDPKPRSRKRPRCVVNAERRLNEFEAVQEISKRLPISKYQGDKASQTAVLRMALNYIKTRELMKGLNKVQNGQFSTHVPEDFQGFLMIVNLKGTILYVTENMTELAGPCIVDVIGQTVRDLLHPDDEELVSKFLDVNNLGKQGIFVVRMKSTLAATVRSQEKVEYKNIFVTCRLKKFNSSQSPKMDDSSSVAAIMLCKTEFHIGFPEIIIGTFINLEVDMHSHRFCDVDPKTPWLLGYHKEDMLDKSPDIFKHPSENFPSRDHHLVRSMIHLKILRDGIFVVPHIRIMAGWGQWLWTTLELTPLEVRDNKLIRVIGRIIFLGPDNSEDYLPTCPKLQDVPQVGPSNVEEFIDHLTTSSSDPLSLEDVTTWYNIEPFLSSNASSPSNIQTSLTDISHLSSYSSNSSLNCPFGEEEDINFNSLFD